MKQYDINKGVQTASIVIRINYKDWKLLRLLFPIETKNETVSHYIWRLIKWIKERK